MFAEQSSMLISHWVPVNPWKHSHRKLLIASLHEPFKHGDDKQLSKSKKNNHQYRYSKVNNNNIHRGEIKKIKYLILKVVRLICMVTLALSIILYPLFL